MRPVGGMAVTAAAEEARYCAYAAKKSAWRLMPFALHCSIMVEMPWRAAGLMRLTREFELGSCSCRQGEAQC